MATSRDAWAYHFNPQVLADNMQCTIAFYNAQVKKWVKQEDKNVQVEKRVKRADKKATVDDFVVYDDTQISWSRDLKLDLKRGHFAEFKPEKIRHALYRPFVRTNLFFDRIMNEEVYVFPKIFPTPETENENRVICVSDKGYRANYSVLMVNIIPELHLCASIDAVQCFPFYTYAEDGTARQENLTDWAHDHFQRHYQDTTITKWAIFHYVYGLLHHPDYREKYAANLKRELPRLPLVADFWTIADIGEKLAHAHLHYEQATPYPLKVIENNKYPFNLKVEKMKLSKDKREIKYNDFLTLTEIPPRVFDYKLGNRSAVEWVIDQYAVKTDPRSGIINDPNRETDASYILELIKKIVTVSLETLTLIETLPKWDES